MIISFGFGQSRPLPAHSKVFDVRDLTHNEKSPAFVAKVQEILEYSREHPAETICIGCKLGKHRSVKIAEQVAKALRRSVFHRDQ